MFRIKNQLKEESTMKSMRRFKRALLIALNIMMIAMIAAPMVYVANAATRDENIQKIHGFLNNNAVKEGLQKEHGVSTEKILNSLNGLSDSQIENLANHANLQVGGAIEDSGVGDFWKTWGLYMIVAMVLSVILMLAV